MISGTLADMSQEAVGRLLRRSNEKGSWGTKKNDNNMQQCDSSSMVRPINLFFICLFIYQLLFLANVYEIICGLL